MTSQSRVVVHDVPVAVIPTRFWENFQEPILPSYDVRRMSFVCYKFFLRFSDTFDMFSWSLWFRELGL